MIFLFELNQLKKTSLRLKFQNGKRTKHLLSLNILNNSYFMQMFHTYVNRTKFKKWLITAQGFQFGKKLLFVFIKLFCMRYRTTISFNFLHFFMVCTQTSTFSGTWVVRLVTNQLKFHFSPSSLNFACRLVFIRWLAHRPYTSKEN